MAFTDADSEAEVPSQLVPINRATRQLQHRAEAAGELSGDRRDARGDHELVFMIDLPALGCDCPQTVWRENRSGMCKACCVPRFRRPVIITDVSWPCADFLLTALMALDIQSRIVSFHCYPSLAHVQVSRVPCEATGQRAWDRRCHAERPRCAVLTTSWPRDRARRG